MVKAKKAKTVAEPPPPPPKVRTELERLLDNCHIERNKFHVKEVHYLKNCLLDITFIYKGRIFGINYARGHWHDAEWYLEDRFITGGELYDEGFREIEVLTVELKEINRRHFGTLEIANMFGAYSTENIAKVFGVGTGEIAKLFGATT